MGYYEHDGCSECKYAVYTEDDLPCHECKGTVLRTSPEHKTRPDYWTPCGTDTKDDVINHPSHYTQGDIECIVAMKSAFGAAQLAVYCKIAAFKYIWRCDRKNGAEDIKKAIWYLNKFLELEGDADDTV